MASGHEIRLTNCIAVSDGIADRNKSEFAPWSVKGELITCDFNTLPEDFLSIRTEGMDGPRDDNGKLPDLDFMKIRPDNTRLIDSGTAVMPYIGESVYSKGITFNGIAPDLGCFETNGSQSGINYLETSAKECNISATIAVAKCGLVVVNVEGLDATACSSASAYDQNGCCLASTKFSGNTVSLDLKEVKGIIIIRISTPRGMTAFKVKI